MEKFYDNSSAVQKRGQKRRNKNRNPIPSQKGATEEAGAETLDIEGDYCSWRNSNPLLHS